MKIRAAIFDIYGTLLEVGPPPGDAEEQWLKLWLELLKAEPRMTRLEFSVACSRVISRQHAASKARGILKPEVTWPDVVAEAVPEFRVMPPADQEAFLWRQIRTGHTIRLSEETARVLQQLCDAGCVLGIASNAQAYTLRELQESLAAHGLGMEIFKPELCFWSYQHGFSKPDPHVFQILTARLASLGIAEQETVMVGDRIDNDIEPARAYGWHTWHLGEPGKQGNGSLATMLTFLGLRTP